MNEFVFALGAVFGALVVMVGVALGISASKMRKP